jgi:ABC-type multidrug transport system fused ATPase/permease subunit
LAVITRTSAGARPARPRAIAERSFEATCASYQSAFNPNWICRGALDWPLTIPKELEVTLVLDRSGSMNGEKLEQVREAARQIIAGTLSLGEWQEFSLYLVYLFMPVAMFGFIITQMGQASASAARVFAILDAQNDVTDKPGAVEMPEVQGNVRFENVTFRYFNSGEPVLKNVTFEARPGERIACWVRPGPGKAGERFSSCQTP